MKKCNLLVPMAGTGARFIEKGYSLPKPLIKVSGKPMIEWVIGNFDPGYINNYFFVCRREHEEEYLIGTRLKELIGDNVTVFYVDSLTEGAACTTLVAESGIDNDVPLLIVNSDQFVVWDFPSFYSYCEEGFDGVILTFNANEAKWSYAKTDSNGNVIEVAEKRPISEKATVGIYFWKMGSEYVKFAKRMVEKNIRTNGEFYVCPVYNEAIEDGKVIKTFDIVKENMWGLGTPEDLDRFLDKFIRSSSQQQI